MTHEAAGAGLALATIPGFGDSAGTSAAVASVGGFGGSQVIHVHVHPADVNMDGQKVGELVAGGVQTEALRYQRRNGRWSGSRTAAPGAFNGH